MMISVIVIMMKTADLRVYSHRTSALTFGRNTLISVTLFTLSINASVKKSDGFYADPKCQCYAYADADAFVPCEHQLHHYENKVIIAVSL